MKKRKKSKTLIGFYRSKWKNSPQAAFTMIELLIVILIVSILSAVALTAFLDFRYEGRIAAVQDVLRNLTSALKIRETQAKYKCEVPMDYKLPGSLVAANTIILSDGPNSGLCLTAASSGTPTKTWAILDSFYPPNPFKETQHGAIGVFSVDNPYNPCDYVDLAGTATAYYGTINPSVSAPSMNPLTFWSNSSTEPVSYWYNERTADLWGVIPQGLVKATGEKVMCS